MSTRNLVPIQQKYSRVIVLVDMDCFYCQVEEKLDPTLKGQPMAVVQYNAWRGGGIIAVNYAARAQGVTRHMRGDEAQQQCPDIKLVKVPNVREKADLSKYREAGKEVAKVLQRFTPLLERASVDEAYLDITEEVNKRLGDMNAGSFMLQPHPLTNCYAVGFNDIGDFVNTISACLEKPNHVDANLEMFQQAHDSIDAAASQQSNLQLLIGAAIAGEIRAAVKAETGYECSAGIAHNKILAKLACGINKPNKQTILPLTQIPVLFETLPVGKITGLGGKFGEEICQRLNIRFLGQVLRFTEAELQRKFDEKNGTWLYNICRGIDLEAITPRFYSKSIGCCKKFPGRNNITGLKTLIHWLTQLANEVVERLENDVIENNRHAKQMVVSFVQDFDGQEISSSRSAPLTGYDVDIVVKSSLEVLQTHSKQFFRAGSMTVLNNPIKFLGISVGKFETIISGQSRLEEMFANQAAKKKKIVEPTTTEATNRTLDRCAAGASKRDTCDKKNSVEVKKPTLMQNFLKNTKFSHNQEIKTNTNGSELSAADIKEAQPTKPELFIDLFEPVQHVNNDIGHLQPGKSTLDSKALDVQPPKSVTELAETKEISLVSKKQLGGCKSKGFFAKMLSESAVETVKKIEVAPQTVKREDSQLLETNMKSADASLQRKELESPSIETTTIFATDTNNKRKYITSAELEHSQDSLPTKRSSMETYETSYAEFAVPELRPELLQLVKCLECGADVPADDNSQQLHQDHHLAQKMVQELREEYRTKVKSQTMAKKSLSVTTSKKQKKSVRMAKTKDNITKFLKPKESSIFQAAESTPIASTSIPVEKDLHVAENIICDECHQLVLLPDLTEHKDFHVAKALQRKLNLLEVRTVAKAKHSTLATAALNSPKLSRTLHSRNKNTKSITQFFSQTNC